MESINLDEIRADIAACRFLEEGSTQELRQAANAKRVHLYRQLDQCRSKLDKLVDTAASTGADYSEIEVRIGYPQGRAWVITSPYLYWAQSVLVSFPYYSRLRCFSPPTAVAYDVESAAQHTCPRHCRSHKVQTNVQTSVIGGT